MFWSALKTVANLAAVTFVQSSIEDVNLVLLPVAPGRENSHNLIRVDVLASDKSRTVKSCDTFPGTYGMAGEYLAVNAPREDGDYFVQISGGSILTKSVSFRVENAKPQFDLPIEIIEGDVDQSEVIDFDDLDLLSFYYGTSRQDDQWLMGASESQDLPAQVCDLNGSQVIDIGDVDILIANYGEAVDALVTRPVTEDP